MKNECLNYNYTYDANYPVERLVIKIAENSQVKTQRGEDKRPYGVGLLVAGYDSSGPRLFRTCPSANYYEYICVAIGARSQGATTFLENNMERFKSMSDKELILYGLRAMKKAQDVKVNGKNLDVLIVGKDTEAKVFSEAEIEAFLADGENMMEIS